MVKYSDPELIDLIDAGTVVKSGHSDIIVIVSDELVHMISLVGENASKEETVQDAVDGLTSIGGIIHSVKLSANRLSICFTHDPLTALKALHGVLIHHGLKCINLKENLKQITAYGRELGEIKSKIKGLMDKPDVHNVYINPTRITLTVDQTSVDEITELL